MKISILNYSDTQGGAARAAYRIHHALRLHGLDSTMFVDEARTSDWTIKSPNTKWGKLLANVRPTLVRQLVKYIKHNDQLPHSLAIFPTKYSSKLNNSDADVVHLHWVNNDMVSIKDIGKIKKPLIWTLHDMWAFCGTEHVTDNYRWRDGYSRYNRPNNEVGLDFDRWVWNRKCKFWRNKIQIVAPSHWLADCVQRSALMHDWPVSVVHNAIDTRSWGPVDKNLARQLLGIHADGPLLLFGTFDENSIPYKGFDLLNSALEHLQSQIHDLQLVIFGQSAPKKLKDLGYPVHYTGHLYDDLSLKVLYSAVDLTVIPSRQDNLPNIGQESLACGTPVVAFDTCGLPDIVRHNQTGYLAKAFDTEDLAQGIQWVLDDLNRYVKLSDNARKDAVARFSYPVVAEQYLKIYKSAIANHLR